MLVFLQAKGIAHENEYLSQLEAENRRIAIIPDSKSLSDRVQLTIDAMHRGEDVVYQAAFHSGCWHGFADFLERSSVPSILGDWSYDVVDTKLSTSVSENYIVQLSIYCMLIAKVQGCYPSRMSIVLGNGCIETLRPDDYVHSVADSQRNLEDFLSDDAVRSTTVPDPCAYCGMCRWRDRCNHEWEAVDHLSLVANIRTTQREKLVAAGISTVVELAEMPDDQHVSGMPLETLERLRIQARLQVAVRGTDDHLYHLLPYSEGKGLARMPKPSAADLFFDMEGDPLYPGGLEYLFGVHVGDPEYGVYRAYWGHDRLEEKKALEEFLDFVTAHIARYPDAHIYHYNHYEVSAIKRLVAAHATREAIVENLLSQNWFVDLLKVVREGILISEPRYTLKNIEHFYMPRRTGEVATAADSVVAYERWRVEGYQQMLVEIEHYNAIDCRSTALLRDWLLSILSPNTVNNI